VLKELFEVELVKANEHMVGPRLAPREMLSAPFKGRSRLCAAGEMMSPAASTQSSVFTARTRLRITWRVRVF
jgi:hypothetical protein